MTITFDLVVST